MCSVISSNNITLNGDFDISYHGGGNDSSSCSSEGGVISCSNKNENVIVDNNNNNDMNPHTTDMYNNSSINNNNNNNNNNTMILLLPLIISYCSCSWISIALSYYSLTQVTITSLSNHRLDFLIFSYMKPSGEDNDGDNNDDDDDDDFEKYKNILILTPEEMRKMEYFLGIYEPTIAKMPSLSIGSDVNVVFESLDEYQVI